MPGEAARQPSSVIGNSAVSVLVKSLAALTAGTDLATAADPYLLMPVKKATRILAGNVTTRGTPDAIDGTDSVTIAIYRISAAGVVSGPVLSAVLITEPAAVGKLLPNSDLGNVVATYQDVEAGGGIGIAITQAGSANLCGTTGVLDVYLTLAPADNTAIVGN